MGAPKGNKYWQLREKHGRYKIFEQPDELWEKCCEYFQWIDENPFHKLDFKGAQIQEVIYPIPKPYTESGLCVYLGISVDTWENYCSNVEPYKDFFGVSMMVKQIIKTQKFEGAASGFFNASIIARDLGLADKREHTGKDGKDLIPDNKEQIESEIDQIKEELRYLKDGGQDKGA